MTSLVSASQVITGQVQSLDSLRAHSLPSDAMIYAGSTLTSPPNQNPGSYALVESANALTLTTTGSVPVVTQSPFADLYKEGSVYFNGTVGNYITTTATGYIGTAWGTAGMTIEAWVNYPTFTNAALASGGSPVSVQIPTLFGCVQPAGASASIAFGSNVTGYTTFFYNANAGGLQSVTAQTPLSANTWNHIAITCSTSSQIFLFVNGVQSQIVANRNGTLQTAAYFETIQSSGGGASGNNPAIGQFNSTPVTAYLADLRITTGTPVYTGSTSSFATFTVPSAPLSTAATGVTQALIRAGQNSPTIQNGALTFDRGLKQFMNFGPQTFNIATRGFTAVFRYQFNGTATNYERIFQASLSKADQNNSLSITRLGTGGQLTFQWVLASAYATAVNSASGLAQGTTYVAALVYNPSVGSGTAQWWINGSPSGTAITGLSSAITSDLLTPFTFMGVDYLGGPSTAVAQCGNFSSNTLAIYNRALSNVEILNAYSALTTTPATPLQKTLEIGDVNGVPALSVAGNGQVSVQSIGLSSNVVPWPPAAMTGYDTVINGGVYKARASNEATNSAWNSFDGSTSTGLFFGAYDASGFNTSGYTTNDVNGTSYPGGWLQIQLPVPVTISSYMMNFEGYNYTPRSFWILGSRDAVNWVQVHWVPNWASGSTGWTTFTLPTPAVQAFSYFRMVVNKTGGSTGVTAYVREWTLYGTADASPTLTIAPATVFNTSVATPSLTGIAAAGVYAPQDFSTSGLNIPAYVVSNTATVANTVAYSSFGPFAGEGSLYFLGGGAPRISFGVQPQFAYNWTSYDFTMECFLYNTSRPYDQRLLSRDADVLMYIQASGNLLTFYSAGITSPVSGSFTGGTVPLNQWNHLAVSYIASTSTFYICVNGSVTTVPKVTGTFQYTGTNTTNFDYWFGQSGSNFGYLSNFRFTRGAALYTATFTPPTGPLQPIQGTTQAGLPYGTVLLLRNAPAPGRIQTTRLTGSNSGSVLSFPPAAMTGYSTALSSGYGQGTYVASASSEFSTDYVWKAFDKNEASAWQVLGWSSSAPYGPIYTTTTTDVTGTAYTGEWCQIQLHSSIVLSSYQMLGSYYATTASPGKWWVLGSRDGTSWFLVDQRSGVTNGTSKGTYPVSASQAFTHYRMVINQLQGNNQYGQVTEWTLNGSIESVNVTADGRVGLGVVNPTSALEVAGDVVCGGTLSAGNPLMFRNAIYNGDMRINQRGISTNWASPTGISTSGTGLGYSLDRQNHIRGGNVANGALAQGTLATTDAPYSQGIQYYLRVGRTSGDTSTQFISWGQMLESKESYKFAGGPITFSCWYRTGSGYSGTGFTPVIIYGTGIDQNGVASPFTNQVTLSGPTYPNSNAWQRVTFTTFIGASASQVGCYVLYFPAGTAGGFDYFDITGVQLEKGTVATPFEVRPFATELALCQRYYYRLQATSLYSALCQGSFIGSTTNAQCYIPFPVDMRIGADSTRFSNSAVGTFFFGSGPGASCTAIVQIGNTESTRGNQIRFTTSVTQTTGVGCIVEANNTTTAFLAFDAEL